MNESIGANKGCLDWTARNDQKFYLELFKILFVNFFFAKFIFNFRINGIKTNVNCQIRRVLNLKDYSLLLVKCYYVFNEFLKKNVL